MSQKTYKIEAKISNEWREKNIGYFWEWNGPKCNYIFMAFYWIISIPHVAKKNETLSLKYFYFIIFLLTTSSFSFAFVM
jgi:hypothetical protein